MSVFVDLQMSQFSALLFYAIIASALLSQIGLLGGIWAEKFDHLATVTNFVITPLAFVGTFYSVSQLPGLAYQVTQYNPFFYMIDGFRYTMTGHSEANMAFGMVFLLVLTALSSAACQYVLATGYRPEILMKSK